MSENIEAASTCGLRGGQNQVGLSLIRELINIDVVSASRQQVRDGDGGGGVRNIWKSRKQRICVKCGCISFWPLINSGSSYHTQ